MNNMKKVIITTGLVVIALLIGAYFIWSLLRKSTDEFDPSVYFEGEPVSQEEINKVLTKEELEEIDRIYNEEERRQYCIDNYGTEKDPLGLSDDADPRLAECLNKANPENPLGI